MSEQTNPTGEEQDRVPDFVTLYQRAFAACGAQALWVNDPTPADALVITRAVRTHGGMNGRRLAEQIASLCNAPQ